MTSGRSNYVEMVNLTFAVYDKSGNRLLGPVDDRRAVGRASPFADCTRAVRRPDRALRPDSRTAGSSRSSRPARTATARHGDRPSYNCVAVSTTGDPTGAYYRYAFYAADLEDGVHFFPDYPKYGVWIELVRPDDPRLRRSNERVRDQRLRAREEQDGERATRRPAPSSSSSTATTVRAARPDRRRPAAGGSSTASRQPSDGLAGSRSWGRRTTTGRTERPSTRSTSGTCASTGARRRPPRCTGPAQLPVAAVRLELPVRASRLVLARLPAAAGDHQPAQFLDILSYRQRPTWRLAYRNFGKYEALGDQPVGARQRPELAGRHALVRDPP